MANDNKTFYEILGIPRNAKITDINRAYNRFKSEMQKETAVPNPRLAAMAKVAFETLSDPDKRAEYDASLGATMRLVKKKGGGAGLIVASVVALIAIGGAGYWFLGRPATKAAAKQGEKSLSAQELVQAVAPSVGRVQGALMSGEVRELGIAVAVSENEMVTTCRGMAAGMLLSVKGASDTTKAELARSNEELDICILSAKGITATVKSRPGLPGPQEKIQAVLVNANGQAEARQVNVARALQDPKGAAFEVKAAAALPNGTPLFDSQARLVGLVTTPHALGEGLVVALGVSRIAQARGGAAPAETNVAAASPAPAMPAAITSAPAAEPAAPSTAPPARGGPRGSIVEEGFTTLWKEDSSGQLIEVLDRPKVGNIGDPIAYWTRWTNRDVASNPRTSCLVTFGPDEEIVAAYDQASKTATPDGYWYCALTRFQVDLADLDKGDYTFTIFVDGKSVAQGTTRIEKKFWTRDKYAIIVILLGGALLFYVRRKKELGK